MGERRRSTWPVALALVVVAWVLAVVAYAGLRVLVVPDGCYQPADETGMRWARLVLSALAIGLLAPWIVSFTRRDEWWLLPVGLLAGAPAVIGAVVAWTSSWSRAC